MKLDLEFLSKFLLKKKKFTPNKQILQIFSITISDVETCILDIL